MPTCPHCGGDLPATSLLASASGLARHFDCPRCIRRLSLGGAWKVFYAIVLALAFVAVCAYDARLGNHEVLLLFPLAVVIASVLVCRYAYVRRFHPMSLWASAFNVTIFGTALCAVSFASTQ